MLKRECKTQIQNSKCTLQYSIGSQFNSLASHTVTSVHEYFNSSLVRLLVKKVLILFESFMDDYNGNVLQQSLIAFLAEYLVLMFFWSFGAKFQIFAAFLVKLSFSANVLAS